jgi:acetyl-CoA carboxylase biotin carboxyl carrier protein
LSKKKQTSNRPPNGAGGAAAVGRGGNGPMSVELLAEVTRLMKENDLNTVDVRDGDRRIVLKRGAPAPSFAPGATFVHAAPHPQHTAGGAAPAGHSAPPPASSASSSTPSLSESEVGLVPIKSPMVGTFYSSPSPDAKAFVAVGSVVDEDSDVCIIEAMKVFNNIKAETRGTIAKVLVNNGQTVEFGQPLFLVKPS